jgi:hypothetical protein
LVRTLFEHLSLSLNIANVDDGRNALIAQPGVLKGLKIVLEDDSIEVHLETAKCLGLLFDHDPGSSPMLRHRISA